MARSQSTPTTTDKNSNKERTFILVALWLLPLDGLCWWPGSSNAPHPSRARRPPRARGLDHRAEGVQVCRGPPRRGEKRLAKDFNFRETRKGGERGCDAFAVLLVVIAREAALSQLSVESTRCRQVRCLLPVAYRIANVYSYGSLLLDVRVRGLIIMELVVVLR